MAKDCHSRAILLGVSIYPTGSDISLLSSSLGKNCRFCSWCLQPRNLNIFSMVQPSILLRRNLKKKKIQKVHHPIPLFFQIHSPCSKKQTFMDWATQVPLTSEFRLRPEARRGGTTIESSEGWGKGQSIPSFTAFRPGGVKASSNC